MKDVNKILKEGVKMRNLRVICYLFSLLSFVVGYLNVLGYKNVVFQNVYDTISLSIATSFLVLAIFFSVIGFAFYTLEIID